jgi:hypothetical protein
VGIFDVVDVFLAMFFSRVLPIKQYGEKMQISWYSWQFPLLLIFSLAGCEEPQSLTVAPANSKIEAPVPDVPLAPPAVVAPSDTLAGVGLPVNIAPPLVASEVQVPLLGPRWNDDGDKSDDDCDHSCDLGSASFSTTNPENWYEILTPAYPDTVPLSLNRNNGFVKGDLALTPTGLNIQDSGDYWASITAIVLNENEEYTPLIPLFLVRDGVFDPLDNSLQLGATGSLPPNQVVTLQASGILKDVADGTDLSLVATNAGSPQPEAITIISWNIQLHKICE